MNKAVRGIEAQLSGLNEQELRRLLIEHLSTRKLGLNWESSAIERDRALNSDIVLPRVNYLSSVPPVATAPYRNLIIEGDNFDALRLLRSTHANRVDVIYIDPPYNKGKKDWVYNDSFVRETDRYRHSMWLEYMYQRLMLARDLLSPTGSIFVSIDDEEAARLALLMDEVFGANNRMGTFIWRKSDSPHDNKPAFTVDHEYILCYALDKAQCVFQQMPAPDIVKDYNRVADDGRRYRDRLLKKNGKDSMRGKRESMFFPIPGPDGVDVYPIHDTGEEARWAAGTKGVARHIEAKTLIWKQREKLGKTVWEPYTREWAPPSPSRPYPTIWSDVPTMRQAKAMLRDIFGKGDVFDTPKPVELIERILRLVSNKDALVLDFFAGSGTTGHAVLRLNAEDGGRRRFVLVSSSEATSEHPDRNVCRDICAVRVKAAIDGYKPAAAADENEIEGEPGAPLGGDFAYVEMDRIAPADLLLDATPAHATSLLALRHTTSCIPEPQGPAKLIALTADGTAIVYLPKVDEAAIEALKRVPHPRLAVYSDRPKTVAELMDKSGKVGNSYSVREALAMGQAMGAQS